MPKYWPKPAYSTLGGATDSPDEQVNNSQGNFHQKTAIAAIQRKHDDSAFRSR